MPDFTDPARFPGFYELPSSSSSSETPPSDDDNNNTDNGSTRFLLAQVKENMTITKPTLILTDRKGVDFAVTFEAAGFGLRGFRKGYTAVVPQAVRTDREEGKKAVLRVGEGECAGVKVIPGGLQQVYELGLLLDTGGLGRKCAACARVQESLMRCTGCGTAAYCSKECQTKGWTEMGHKSNCKVLKSIKEIWP